jgi:hypothetical protein
MREMSFILAASLAKDGSGIEGQECLYRYRYNTTSLNETTETTTPEASLIVTNGIFQVPPAPSCIEFGGALNLMALTAVITTATRVVLTIWTYQGEAGSWEGNLIGFFSRKLPI